MIAGTTSTLTSPVPHLAASLAGSTSSAALREVANPTADAYVPSGATPAPARKRGRFTGFLANTGLGMVGGLAAAGALALGVGLFAGPDSLSTFGRIALMGGPVPGAIGGAIGAGLKAHKTGNPYQPGRALAVGAAAGAVGTVGVVGLIIMALRSFT